MSVMVLGEEAVTDEIKDRIATAQRFIDLVRMPTNSEAILSLAHSALALVTLLAEARDREEQNSRDVAEAY